MVNGVLKFGFSIFYMDPRNPISKASQHGKIRRGGWGSWSRFKKEKRKKACPFSMKNFENPILIYLNTVQQIIIYVAWFLKSCHSCPKSTQKTTYKISGDIYILGNRRKSYHQFEHVERPWLMGMMDYHVQGDYDLMLLKMPVMMTNRDFEFGRWLEPSGPTLFPRFFFFFSLLCHRWPSLPPPPGSVSCQNKIWIPRNCIF